MREKLRFLGVDVHAETITAAIASPAQALPETDHGRQGSQKIMTAIARELLGFIWAISIRAEQACTPQLAA